MKLINGDKLERHLDYLIKRDNQFAKMCDGDDDYSRQRKYCFEVDALAYQLCKSVMDYYLVKDVQPVNRWVSVDEALPIYDGLVLAVDKNNTVRLCVYTELGWLSQYGNPLVAHITHWQPLPKPPKVGDAK